MRLNEAFSVAILSGLVACSDKPSTGDSIVKDCVHYSDELRHFYTSFPRDTDTISNDLSHSLDSAVDIFRLRYSPDLDASQADLFRSDFLNYLRQKKIVFNVCSALVDQKVLTDYVDLFVKDHPGNFHASTLPKEDYDEARFSTLPIWGDEAITPIVGVTLRYSGDYSSIQEGPRIVQFDPHLKLDGGEKIQFTYLDLSSGVSYQFVVVHPPCDYPMSAYCGQLIFLANDGTKGAQSDLGTAVMGLHAYQVARWGRTF